MASHQLMKKLICILLYLTSFKTYAQINCDNWLYTPSRYSYVDIGKLNVTGNKITVEAVFNRTTPYVPGGGDGTEGDLVSKNTIILLMSTIFCVQMKVQLLRQKVFLQLLSLQLPL